MIKDVYVVRDEEHPVGRLLEEELPEQRHGPALLTSEPLQSPHRSYPEARAPSSSGFGLPTRGGA